MGTPPLPLPAVTNLPDCASFTLTVLPYLQQFSLAHLRTLSLFPGGTLSPSEWYLSTNPLVTAGVLAILVAAVTFVSAEVNRNYSQIDRLWPILPAGYVVHFVVWARMNGVQSERLETLAVAVGVWCIRLTYNYYRKGGYKWGAEDYRWVIVKSWMPSWVFVIFDLTFISIYQSLLLLAVTFPCYLLLLVSQVPGHAAMTTSDTVISRILAVILILETLADQQQWNYQQAKSTYKATGKVPEGFSKEDLDRGFVVSGLWSIVRHPNFTCEQAFWLGVYQWGCWQTETMWNWAGIGALAYCGIFQGSTRLTEDITGKKYPEYKEYQRLVNCFVPGFKSFSAPKMVEGEGKVKKEL